LEIQKLKNDLASHRDKSSPIHRPTTAESEIYGKLPRLSRTSSFVLLLAALSGLVVAFLASNSKSARLGGQLAVANRQLADSHRRIDEANERLRRLRAVLRPPKTASTATDERRLVEHLSGALQRFRLCVQNKSVDFDDEQSQQAYRQLQVAIEETISIIARSPRREQLMEAVQRLDQQLREIGGLLEQEDSLPKSPNKAVNPSGGSGGF
jgi:hypothetical protein